MYLMYSRIHKSVKDEDDCKTQDMVLKHELNKGFVQYTCRLFDGYLTATFCKSFTTFKEIL